MTAWSLITDRFPEGMKKPHDDPRRTDHTRCMPQKINHSRTEDATVVQTRTLKALTEPLTASGRVWFAAPDRFRWELGDPPKTIALRVSDEMIVIYPRLKRVERYRLAGDQTGPWRDALALLEAGFPRSQTDL